MGWASPNSASYPARVWAEPFYAAKELNTRRSIIIGFAGVENSIMESLHVAKISKNNVSTRISEK
jgi:hypothetical protein